MFKLSVYAPPDLCMTRDKYADAITGDPHIVPPGRIDADEIGIEGRCDVLARYSVLFHTYLRWDLGDHGCSS